MHHSGAGTLRPAESSGIPPLPPQDLDSNKQYVMLGRRTGTSDSAVNEYLWSAVPELQASGTGAGDCNNHVIGDLLQLYINQQYDHDHTNHTWRSCAFTPAFPAIVRSSIGFGFTESLRRRQEIIACDPA